MQTVSQLDQAVVSGKAQVLGGAAVLPDGTQVPLSPEDAKAALDAAAQAEEKQAMMMRSLIVRLQQKCDDAVKAKRIIEQRWVDDIRQYDGAPRVKMSKQDVTSVNRATLEPPRIHATRNRTDLLESRLIDMLFPTNDHIFDMVPTPDSEWEQPDPSDPGTAGFGVLPPVASQQQGLPADPTAATPPPGAPNAPQANPSDQKDQDEAVFKACDAMKKVIQDQLKECKFSAIGRKMVRDGVRIGCGVICGPMVTTKIQRRFDGPNMTMNIRESEIPEVRYADPWCFFPDMTPTIEKAEFVFYLHMLSAREVMELLDHPGFDKKEIAALLKEEPDLGELRNNLAYRNNNLERIESIVGRYAVWRYTGTLDRKDMQVLADMYPDLKQDIDESKIDLTDELQPIPMLDAWYSQQHILKARLRPIEKDFRVPYFVFSPFPADDTMFGYSLPYLVRDSSRVVDAAWQIVLHNASVSAGPIIIMRAGKIEPRDRSYEFKGPKVMEVTDPEMELAECLQVLNIPNNADQALTILDRALSILDDEAMTPLIMQGDATESVPTSSGLAMLFNATSIVMRRAAACGDDDVFVPLVQRLYWWNMLFNKRQDIKGNYDILPLGQTKLLVKDVQLQHLQAFMQQGMNPALAPYINMGESLRLWAQLLELPTDKILNDPDTVKAQQAAASQQPNPQDQLMTAQVQKLAAETQNQQTIAQLNATKAQHLASNVGGQKTSDPATIQLQAADQQTRRMEAQAQVESESLKLQGDLQKMDHQHAMATNDNIVKQNIATQNNVTDLQKEGMRTRVKAAQIARQLPPQLPPQPMVPQPPPQ